MVVSYGYGLGWEFQFLVPISGTPIGSGIPIPYSIPEILFGHFFSFADEKLTNWNFDSEIWNSKKYIGTQYTSFRTRKQVVPIPTSTQNCCRHTYIYSKRLLPYLHLLKTVAVIPTSTQNGCRHTYIYSKRLPPYLHLLKMVAAIPTSTQNGYGGPKK
jgi:hypothetical protein